MNEDRKKILKDFVDWLKIKFKIHISEEPMPSFKERDIWWASVGMNIGSEQNGKDQDFQRPVLVLKKFGHYIFLAAPLTSKKKDNPYRLETKYVEYSENIMGDLISEEKLGIVILNQLKTISSKRLIRKMGVMPEEGFNVVREKIKEMI